MIFTMKRYSIFLLFSLALVAGLMVDGCRSHKDVVQPEAQQRHNCPYERLTGTFDCEVSGVDVNGLLRTECDSVIWITVSKIIELGRIQLTPDSVAGYVKIYNRFFKGSYNDVYRLTGVKTSFAELQQKFAEAYKQGQRQVVLDVNARQWNDRIVMNFNKLERSVAPLSYPFRIPAGAQPIRPSDL